MTYAYSDGELSTNDATMMERWRKIKEDQYHAQIDWSARLLGIGVKLEHPDDGWVTRNAPEPYLTPCYPVFNLNPKVGDIIALGWPRRINGNDYHYRIVTVTKVGPPGFMSGTQRYYYEDKGVRL